MYKQTGLFIRHDDIAQGTDFWHAWRNSVIGSSDAPVIMGENPWKTAKALLEEKLGHRTPFNGNSATRRGTELEPQARSLYEESKGVSVAPSVLQNKLRPWQAASEIKCGIKAYEHTAQTGHVPHHYYGQLQHILAVSGLSFIDYFCYKPESGGILVEVERDEPYINRLLVAEETFCQLLIGRGGKLASG